MKTVIFTPEEGKNFFAVVESSAKRFLERFEVVYFKDGEELKKLISARKILSILQFAPFAGDPSPLDDLTEVGSVSLGIFGVKSVRKHPLHAVARISSNVPQIVAVYCPILPHMVRLPYTRKNWRKKLNIPVKKKEKRKKNVFDLMIFI
jgi:hypothetical protein